MCGCGCDTVLKKVLFPEKVCIVEISSSCFMIVSLDLLATLPPMVSGGATPFGALSASVRFQRICTQSADRRCG